MSDNADDMYGDIDNISNYLTMDLAGRLIEMRRSRAKRKDLEERERNFNFKRTPPPPVHIGWKGSYFCGYTCYLPMSDQLARADPICIIIKDYLNVRSHFGIHPDRLPKYPETRDEVEHLLEYVLNIDGINDGRKYSIYAPVAELQKRIADYPIIDRTRFQDSRTRLLDMMRVYMPAYAYFADMYHQSLPLPPLSPPDASDDAPVEDSNLSHVGSPLDAVSPDYTPDASDDDGVPALPESPIGVKSEIKSEPAVTRRQALYDPNTTNAPLESDGKAPALPDVFKPESTPSEAFPPLQATQQGESSQDELRAKRVLSRDLAKPDPVKRSR